MNSNAIAMMAALQGGNATDEIGNLLAAQSDLDPKTRAVLELVSRSAEQTPEPDDAGGRRRPGQIGTKRRRRHVMQRARDLISSLKDELAAAYELVDALAHATGACKRCFGQDSDCPKCSGRGRPGWSAPDRGMFEQFVLPAVRRIEAASGSPDSHSTTMTQRKPTSGQ